MQNNKVQCYQHQFLNGNSINFFSHPLNGSSDLHIPKKIDPQLLEVILDPKQSKSLHASEIEKKIFLGFAAKQPGQPKRIPIWISPKILFSSVLIGGSIGSGKSTLIARLLAGTLDCGMTTIIGEAKGGLEINPQNSAFAKLASYLANKLEIKSYRWPRGNCYFNPLLYLNTFSERQTFMNSIANQSSATGEMKAFVDRAGYIAAYVLEILETTNNFSKVKEKKEISLRCLVNYIKQPTLLDKDIKKFLNDNLLLPEHSKVKNIAFEIERLNFFALASPEGRDRFAMTLSGINFFVNLLDEEDLLYYTEPHSRDQEGNELKKLNLDDILYNRALVVVSQPLASNHASAKIVGSIFWDALLSYTLKLGLPDKTASDRKRQDLAVFLDETHRLPTGRIGESGDFLREYRVGIVEITPAIVDRERWERNKHVYQTIISTSPGVSEVCELMHERLPSYIPEQLEVGIDVNMTGDRKLGISPHIINRQYEYRNQDNPGVFPRSLRHTGRYTALLQTADREINANGIFWIDLESPIMAKLDELLEEALQGKRSAAKLVDYGLGLIQEYP
jgi:hypothetical protein